jgi:hypothetical protein
MAIDWGKLKNNKQGKGFENLALEYLQKNFKGNWEATPQTRDGNKDAISIVYLNKEAWAEAKYTSKDSLSRYRLDATIVSAIINKDDVIEIIFITNSEINNDTQNSIKKALKNAMGDSCTVSFRTKRDIEYWLYKNPDTFEKYFSENKDVLFSLESDFSKITATSSISFYNAIRHSVSFNESLKELYVGEPYRMLFSVFSPHKRKQVPISLNTDILKIANDSLSLFEGDNIITVNVLCAETGILSKNSNNNLLVLNDNILVKQELPKIEVKLQTKLDVKAQKEISDKLLSSLNLFKSTNTRVVHAIEGGAAVGKTTLINSLFKSDVFENLDVIVQCFTDDSNDNQKLLIRIVLLIFFYYIPYDEIDEQYLKSLIDKNEYISTYLLELVKAKESSLEDLAIKIREYSNSKEFFPKMIKLNKKVLILDDLHKLDEISREFLFNLIADICNSNIECYIILLGRHQFWANTEFKEFAINNSFLFHKLQFTSDDILQSLKINELQVDAKGISIVLSRIQPNAIFTIKLIEYLYERKEQFNKWNSDAQFVYINRFVVDCDYENRIIEEFQMLTKEESILLNSIYYSRSGVQKSFIKEKYLPLVENRLSHLIKNIHGVYAPIHDIHQDLFKRKYPPQLNQNIKQYLKKQLFDYEIIRDNLLFYDNTSDLKEILSKMKDMERHHQFYTIHYLLEPIFDPVYINNTQKEKFKNSIRFQLQLMYARSITNCSRKKSGKECFQVLYKDIRNCHERNWDESKKISIVFGGVLGELINSSFEHLNFKNVKKYASEFENLAINDIKKGYIKRDDIINKPGYLLVEEIKFLTSLAIDPDVNIKKDYNRIKDLCTKVNNLDKIDINRIRLARSIIHSNPTFANELLNKAIKSLVKRESAERKWVLLGNFEKVFLYFQESENPTMKEIMISHEALKTDFYNDYRKASLAVASSYLFLGMQGQTYEYLYDDFFIKREMRSRLKGMRLHLLALYEYHFNKDIPLALEYLNDQKHIFRPLGASYNRIIDHNIKVMQMSPPDNVLLHYYRDKNLSKNVLYIEPRLW